MPQTPPEIGESLIQWLNCLDTADMSVEKFRGVLNRKFLSIGYEDTLCKITDTPHSSGSSPPSPTE